MQCLSCTWSVALEDQFCPNCGEPCSRALLAFPVDARRIWLGEILESRYVALFSKNRMYALSDALARIDSDLHTLPGIGGTVLRELRRVIADIEADESTVRAQIENRAGTCFDPIAPVLTAIHAHQISALGQALEQLPIQSLEMSNSTHTLFRKARLRTFEDLVDLCNLELIRLLRPRIPEVIMEISQALDSAVKNLSPKLAIDSIHFSLERDLNSVRQGLDGLQERLSRLDERQRNVLTMRYGLDRSEPRTLEEVGQTLGVTRERVRQIEKKAISILRNNPAALAHVRSELIHLARLIGISTADDRFAIVATELGSLDLTQNIALLPLALKVMDLDANASREISDVDAAIIAVLAGGQRLSLDDLVRETTSFLEVDELDRNPEFDIAARIRLLGPAVADGIGFWSLPSGKIAGFNDKRIRRIQTMRLILEEHGPSHFSFVAEEMRNRLPEDFWLDERGVQSWFSRLTSIFIWSGQGTYGLKSQGIGIRKEVEMTALDGSYRSKTSRRKGIGDEIAALLLENGPTSLESIEAHILSRFTVQQTSVYAAIMQDKAGRFDFDSREKVCSLRPEFLRRAS